MHEVDQRLEFRPNSEQQRKIKESPLNLMRMISPGEWYFFPFTKEQIKGLLSGQKKFSREVAHLGAMFRDRLFINHLVECEGKKILSGDHEANRLYFLNDLARDIRRLMLSEIGMLVESTHTHYRQTPSWLAYVNGNNHEKVFIDQPWVELAEFHSRYRSAHLKEYFAAINDGDI